MRTAYFALAASAALTATSTAVHLDAEVDADAQDNKWELTLKMTE